MKDCMKIQDKVGKREVRLLYKKLVTEQKAGMGQEALKACDGEHMGFTNKIRLRRGKEEWEGLPTTSMIMGAINKTLNCDCNLATNI